MHVNNIIVRSRLLTKIWHTEDRNELGSRGWVFPMHGKDVSRVCEGGGVRESCRHGREVGDWCRPGGEVHKRGVGWGTEAGDWCRPGGEVHKRGVGRGMEAGIGVYLGSGGHAKDVGRSRG